MIEAVGKYVGGKVVTAVLVVAGAGAVIWFWRHPEHLALIWSAVKLVVAWIGFVVVLPWAMFLVTRWAVAKESNTTAAVVLGGYTVVDGIVALCLAGGVRGHSFVTWVVLLLGFLAAGVYNFLVCEYQAARLEDA
ncbi:MAG: hypothetical protein ACE5E6_10960 [Phycisphaerae bacterium]